MHSAFRGVPHVKLPAPAVWAVSVRAANGPRRSAVFLPISGAKYARHTPGSICTGKFLGNNRHDFRLRWHFALAADRPTDPPNSIRAVFAEAPPSPLLPRNYFFCFGANTNSFRRRAKRSIGDA